MIEPSAGGGEPQDEEISAFDLAAYCHTMAAELAVAARRRGLHALALALDLVRELAAQALERTRQRHPGVAKPAPDEAA